MFKKISIAVLFTAAIVAGKSDKPALEGYCPVAYVEMGSAIKGSADHQSKASGKTYLFANAGAKQMFDANPKKYTDAIQYGTYCATAMSMGKKLKSDMAIFSRQDGKIYFFSSADAKAMFEKDSAAFVGKADKAWAKAKKK
ncbi:MAG: YHS domain-containing (seleno)protein [Spirochaetota bacterium]